MKEYKLIAHPTWYMVPRTSPFVPIPSIEMEERNPSSTADQKQSIRNQPCLFNSPTSQRPFPSARSSIVAKRMEWTATSATHWRMCSTQMQSHTDRQSLERLSKRVGTRWCNRQRDSRPWSAIFIWMTKDQTLPMCHSRSHAANCHWQFQICTFGWSLGGSTRALSVPWTSRWFFSTRNASTELSAKCTSTSLNNERALALHPPGSDLQISHIQRKHDICVPPKNALPCCSMGTPEPMPLDPFWVFRSKTSHPQKNTPVLFQTWVFPPSILLPALCLVNTTNLAHKNTRRVCYTET